jgi:hypothetical protein
MFKAVEAPRAARTSIQAGIGELPAGPSLTRFR